MIHLRFLWLLASSSLLSPMTEAVPVGSSRQVHLGATPKATRSASPNLSTLSRDVRRLALGDFDAINRMISHVQFEVPMDPNNPIVIQESGVTMTVTSMTCFNFWMGDVDLQWSGSGEQQSSTIDLSYYGEQKYIAASVEMMDLDLQCYGTFDFEFC